MPSPDEAAALTGRVLDIAARIEHLPTLAPCPDVDALFTELVALTATRPERVAAAVLTDPRVRAAMPVLHARCGEAEAHLEAHWAERVLASPSPSIELERFPYYDNYEQLTALEARAWALAEVRPRPRVLFLGAGPLPLTPILLAQRHGVAVDALERDPSALDLGRRVVARLGLADAVRILEGDASRFDSYSEYDVVILGALVGGDAAAKRAVLDRVRSALRPGAVLVARSAHSLRTLLYPPVELEDAAGLEPIAVVQPLNEIINSVALFRAPALPLEDPHVEDARDVPGGFAAFRAFCLEIIGEEYGYGFDPRWHADLHDAERVYGAPRAGALLVRRGDEVLGCIAFRPYDRDYAFAAGRYDAATTAGVWRFFTRRPYREQLVPALHAALEDRAREAGYGLLYAHEQKHVPGALRKYVDVGYSVTYDSQDELGTVHFEKPLA